MVQGLTSIARSMAVTALRAADTAPRHPQSPLAGGEINPSTFPGLKPGGCSGLILSRAIDPTLQPRVWRHRSIKTTRQMPHLVRQHCWNPPETELPFSHGTLFRGYPWIALSSRRGIRKGCPSPFLRRHIDSLSIIEL